MKLDVHVWVVCLFKDLMRDLHTRRSVFNLRRLQAHTKTMELLIRELLFADDAALLAHTEAAMQRITSCFAKSAQIFGLEVSLKKTEVLHQPAPQKEYHPPSISIEQTELKVVHHFSYLGCVISSDANIDKEVDNRLAKANSAFSRLYGRVWNNNNLKKDTKVSVYKAVVLTTLLYGAESWVTYRHHLRLLSVSISAASAQSSAFVGVTLLPILKSSS